MKLKDLFVKTGDRIRRDSWPEDHYLCVTNPMAYNGTESSFDPRFYSPEGMLIQGDRRSPFWIFPNNHNDWIIL